MRTLCPISEEVILARPISKAAKVSEEIFAALLTGGAGTIPRSLTSLVKLWRRDWAPHCQRGKQAQTQPCRLRSHHSRVRMAAKISRKGQLSQTLYCESADVLGVGRAVDALQVGAQLLGGDRARRR